MPKQHTTTSNLACTECGHVFPLARKTGKRKAVGHIKHLWCITCKAETAHEEKESEYAY